jgi:WhiB family redox-sensing transcriptional regulator
VTDLNPSVDPGFGELNGGFGLLVLVVGRPAWQEQASCRGVDPDLFFPERGEPAGPAKEVCSGCVVRSECADYAIARPEKFGVWGGMAERERRKMRHDRRQAGA